MLHLMERLKFAFYQLSRAERERRKESSQEAGSRVAQQRDFTHIRLVLDRLRNEVLTHAISWNR
jgi:hypothetical protein